MIFVFYSLHDRIAGGLEEVSLSRGAPGSMNGATTTAHLSIGKKSYTVLRT